MKDNTALLSVGILRGIDIVQTRIGMTTGRIELNPFIANYGLGFAIAGSAAFLIWMWYILKVTKYPNLRKGIIWTSIIVFASTITWNTINLI